MVAYDYVHGKNLERPELLEGMDLTTTNYGAGFSLVYDSRDVLTNPHKGYYLNISQCFVPSLWEMITLSAPPTCVPAIIILFGKEVCLPESLGGCLILATRLGQ